MLPWRDLALLSKFHTLPRCWSREVKADHAFDPIPFRAVEHHPGSAYLFVGRSVRVDAPFRALLCPLVFRKSEFCDEVNNDLSFYSRTWSVLDVEFAQLNFP